MDQKLLGANTTDNNSQHLGVHWYSTNRPLTLIADCRNNNLNNNNKGSRHVKKIASRAGVVGGFPPQLSCSFDGCCNFLYNYLDFFLDFFNVLSSLKYFFSLIVINNIPT